jgi:SNF2 family DNA or RNA helicase
MGAYADASLPVEKEINIYVGLTEMQRKWYRSVLEKDIDAVNGTLLLDLLGSLTSPTPRLDWKKGGQDPAHEHGHAVA